MTLRLVIFDVDGTLIDSQADIVGAMQAAFDAEGLIAPDLGSVLAHVGLSLPLFMAGLAPKADAAGIARLVQGYKDAYSDLRAKSSAQNGSPLYPGARAAIETLHSDDTLLLGVATGKSRRGLDMMIEAHDLRAYFVTLHCAVAQHMEKSA